MALRLRQRLAAIWEKNREEIAAIAGRSMPTFARNRPVSALDSEVPVFVFHSVSPERFERQLKYLSDNGYTTLFADELADCLEAPPPAGHRQVALTFDDATGSFWAVAAPLLRKFGFKGIVFAVAGLVPEDPRAYPNLDDVWAGRASLSDVVEREGVQPLCTWRELLWMHGQGHVDVQSHSLSHARVPVSDDVVDFLHPGFDTYLFGNVNIPISTSDDPEAPARPLRLGAPVYRSAPRLAGIPGFCESTRLTDRLVEFVRSRGEARFFDGKHWRRELRRRFDELATRDSDSRVETSEEAAGKIEDELAESRRILEKRLPGKSVVHFCYPWFTGSEAADELAGRCGYRTVFYGLPPRAEGPGPRRIRRISEEYLHCLPGKGRRWPAAVWWKKLTGRALS